MSDSLSRAFDVNPVEVIDTNGKSLIIVPEGDEDTDHTYARAKHYEIAEAGSEAIQIAMRIAREAESPKAIEALSGLLKNLSEVSKSLVTINKDKYEAKGAKSGKNIPSIGQAVQTQNNINVFTGSSKELNKIINEQLAGIPK